MFVVQLLTGQSNALDRPKAGSKPLECTDAALAPIRAVAKTHCLPGRPARSIIGRGREQAVAICSQVFRMARQILWAERQGLVAAWLMWGRRDLEPWTRHSPNNIKRETSLADGLKETPRVIYCATNATQTADVCSLVGAWLE